MLFFSYSRGNLVVVRSVAAELRRLGYRTWLDLESLRPGERWREAIDRALAASDAMVFCVSRLSVDSAWTSVELRAALDRGLPVIPLMIDPLPIEAMPPALHALHIVTLATYPAGEAPRHAAQAIARSVGRPAPDEAWSDTEAAAALQVQLLRAPRGALLGWRAPLWASPPAPLAAEALAELGRAADETRAAELHVGPGVAAALAALAMGTLVSRLGPARVRLHAPASAARGLAAAARCLHVAVAPAGWVGGAPAAALSPPSSPGVPRRAAARRRGLGARPGSRSRRP